METALTVNRFDEIMASIGGDEKGDLISANIRKYHDLGMTKAEEAAKEGAVAYVLSKFGMNLIKESVEGSNDWKQTVLHVVDFDGNTGAVTHPRGRQWVKKSLKEFDKIMPAEALNKIPKSMADSMVVWEPYERASDPLLCIPLICNRMERVIQAVFHEESKRHFFGLAVRARVTKENREVEVAKASPYYAVVERWM